MIYLKNNIIITILMLVASLVSQTLTDRDILAIRQTADAFERAGQVERAAEYYIRAAKANPKDVAAYLGAKRTLDNLNDYDRLEELINELENVRRDVRYRIDLAWIQYKRGDESGAQKRWTTIIEENSTSQQTYALIGQIYVENQFYEDAIDLYTLGRKNLKNDQAFMYELANIYKIMNEQDKLVQEYIQYLKSYPQQIDFLSAELQRFVQTQDNINPLLKELQKLLKSSEEPAWAVHLFLADIYTMQQDYENALLHFKELEKILQSADFAKNIRSYAKGKYLYDFANTALSSHAVDAAERAFVMIIQDFSDSKYVTAAKIGLAKVYTDQEQYEKALDALQLFVDQNKRSAETRLALMQMGDIAYNKLFDIERAEKAYSQALRNYPEPHFQIETLFRLADCATARNDLDTAESLLKKALAMSAPFPALNGASLMYLAYLEFYRMHPSTSLEYLEDFSNVAYPTNQTNIFENDALELTMLLQSNSYDSTGLAQLGKSALLMQQRQFEQARDLIENYLSSNPTSPLKSELRLRLVDIYKKTNEFEPAVAVLDSVYADSSSFYRDVALLSSAEIYEKDMGNPAVAQQRYEKILVEFPSSIYLETARERVRHLENLK